MNYFQARRAEKLFAEYRQAALEYWAADKQTDEASRRRWAELREKINHLFYTVNTNAAFLHVEVNAHSLPPASRGGPAAPVNFLRGVIDPEQGWRRMTELESLDAIDRCIGAAKYARRKARNRLVNPLCWLVDLPALIVRWPFLIMRKAGVSEKVEENIVSQVLKVAGVVVLMLLAVYFGIVVTVGDIFKLVK